MPIDHTGSCVNLAKQMLMDLDSAAINTAVQTETLRMLLEKLIELGSPQVQVMQAERARTVAETIRSFEQ